MGESQIRHKAHFALPIGAVVVAADGELILTVIGAQLREALNRVAPLSGRMFDTGTRAMDAEEWTPVRRRVARQLPADPHAGRTARRVLDEVCTRWGLDGLRDVAQMIVTELAANAVEHVGPPVELCITIRRPVLGNSVLDNSVLDNSVLGNSVFGNPVLRIEMSDSSTVLPVRLDSSSGAIRGHGLRLVDSLAGRWGTTVSKWGKTVWVELAIFPSGCIRASPDYRW